MKQPHDPEQTADIPSEPADSLDAGLAAGFGRLADRPSSVLSGLREAFGPLRPVLLKEPDGDSAPIVKPKSDVMPLPEQVGERYQLAGEIARGGMGAVLRGRDVDLGRDLAVKVLLEKYVDRPEVARRFIEEAQIGGQLQHPGVVPVYDIGRFGDRPFFTMKLVKGLTLAALLHDRPTPEAGGVVTDTPRFLAIALQVAQTLAYAHAKGVIHRDLKPANIMVGAFGEVQVMDWGLAKVLAEGGIADEQRANREHQQREDEITIRTARSTGSTGTFGDTEAGSVLGTPAYMPPEQANGNIADLDRRADVFGLGAILCEILTGRPPYVGRSNDEVRRKAANGNLSEAHAALDHCGADAELIKLTRACLCAEAADRPKDAQAVAEGLTAYLNGVQARLRQAELAEAEAKTKATEEAKRRRLRLTLAATVVVAVLGGVGGTSFYLISAEKRQNDDMLRAVAERDRQGRNAEAVSGLLDQAFAALEASDADKAQALLDAAGKRLAEGGADDLAGRRERLLADLAVLRELDQVDQFRWTWDGSKFPDAAAVAARIREVLSRFGLTPESVPEAAAARISGSAVRDRLVTALDRWIGGEKLPWLQAVLRAADPDPYRDAVRAAVRANDGPAFVELVGQARAAEQPPGFIAWIGERPWIGEKSVVPVERRRELLTLAVGQRPGDLGLLMTLGNTFLMNQKEDSGKALRWFQAAVAVAPRNSAALNNLSGSLSGQGQLDDAIASYRRAIELYPKEAMAHVGLGVALAEKGQMDAAIACFRTAIELDPNSTYAHCNLGNALTRKGQLDAAVASCRTAIELDPKEAMAHCNLGSALKRKGQWDAAIASYRTAIRLNPKLAMAHFNLGVALSDKGQLDDAIASWRKAIELEPKFAEARTNLARAQRLVAIQGKLAPLLKGDYKPSSNDERLTLADLCLIKKMHRTAAGLYADAFAADPKLAADLQAGHRYNAACCAALAAAGQGEEDAKLDDKERVRLRKQALDWLRADLALGSEQLASGPAANRVAVQKTLQHWQEDSDLAGVREAAALAKLPAAERADWEKLWADLIGLLKKAQQ